MSRVLFAMGLATEVVGLVWFDRGESTTAAVFILLGYLMMRDSSA